MSSRELWCAASSLTAGLLDGPVRPLVETVRTRVSVHYETGDPAVPVLTVCTPSAVRLPAALVTEVLPGRGAAVVGEGALKVARSRWRVSRWWRPARPSGLTTPRRDLTPLMPAHDLADGVPLPRPRYDGLPPAAFVGRGPGLTPAGDDVLAGGLVAAHATDDPRLPRWRTETRRALTEASTTTVSRALLHHAMDGYATAELADFVTAVCEGRDVDLSRARLLAVGHSSGAALLVGVLHTLSTHRLEGAA